MQLLDAITSMQATPTGLSAVIDQRHQMDIHVLELDVVRVWFRKDGRSALDRTWSVTPDGCDVAWQGRERDDLSGFSCPSVQTEIDDATAVVTSGDTRITVNSSPLRLSVERRVDGEWVLVHADRPTGAYYVGSDAVESIGAPAGMDVAHYINLTTRDHIYGLGEKAGDLERTNHSYEMCCVDGLGYDAKSTDPLYKYVPFTITREQSDGNQTLPAYGIFYDNFAHGWMNLGNTIDNYHQRFRSWKADGGDIDFYLIFADSVQGITRRFTALTGRPAFPPRWSIGYSQSTMTYPDMPDAQDQLIHFVELCRKHRMLIGSFQMGSGYSTIGDKRYLFHWNRDKFPDPTKVSEAFHKAGMGFTANLKPCMLVDHPRYQEVADQGLFVQNPQTGGPEKSPFWGAYGSHLDFTNPRTAEWWKKNCTEQILGFGIDVPWNDNNEFEIWDENTVCDGFGRPIPAGLARPILSLLMTRASYEAQCEYQPGKRPFSVARSGGPGLQRYAQTWTGDNHSDWDTLRYNIRMGASMNLSGMYNIGHDVGGFAGVKPEPELFVRWVQNGSMHPRFTFNSWHDDGTVNEPWMYPEVIDEVREAINQRARLTPYFYDLLYKAHAEYQPMLWPMFFVDEADPRLWEESDDFMLGPDILVASVVEKGQRERPVYLPKVDGGWYDMASGRRFDGGQTVTLNAPLDRLPLLARAGSGIPVGELPEQSDEWVDDQRTLMIFPPKIGATSQGYFFEDDGETDGGPQLRVQWQQSSSDDAVDIQVRFEGDYQPAWSELQIQLPQGDSGILRVNGVETDRVAVG